MSNESFQQTFANRSPGALQEAAELVRFARASHVAEGGFGSLDDKGQRDPRLPVDTLITARMTHCFGIGVLLELPDTASFAEHGVRSLAETLHDPKNGGWVVSAAPGEEFRRKRAYQTSFVVLAAATAATAEVAGSRPLLDDALEVMERHFWSQEDSALYESWDAPFTNSESYWGANSNMHGVEALLAAYGYTRDVRWRDRAYAIAENFINRHARATGWMLPEHYAADWTPLPEYNIDTPRDQFRPYGVTIGHLFEWSRLLLELASTYGVPAPWLTEASAGLYEKALEVGWAVDGAEGFVYTVDLNGVPVVRERLHWVVTEAIASAGTWLTLTGAERYRQHLELWSDYAKRYLHDRVHGSWHHELDEHNHPANTVWAGKPDIYHSLQSVLIPALPVAESLSRRIIGA